MERRGMSIAPDELEEKINALLQNEQIPLRLRKAMAREAIAWFYDGGATTNMIRNGWQSMQIQEGVTLYVVDNGRVFLEITDDDGSRRSFSPLPHDSLGHSLAHQEWVPESELT
ncbi:hypothetical protein A2875_03320 [Candidatus Gottesmanbacteria bacterium RIFCSPHIGHO2_01_FULL_46_14]|uniref:Uncharacterized protein n=2 Tax=Candidatus Gottesmaniibacteriota TaxID=1752720 RepID=A0A1F5ZM22_9BACT|nr:MAG: hypothetical protein A2875_03320 [Candidatus Gottesmanbacteria bacterium RIFCSPHIGHO2_01_FULL_46_14]OGG28812.1 MAG: hypothetical protein A2971_02885 [Candidatus Gottesmanbacteria bacterium RIFCSPLOWO2_01_FULL_46_21]